MKQALHLKIGQQLTMTPQLQQAIRLLQLSSLDLQQEIQEALESNVMLELDETDKVSESSSDEPLNGEVKELTKQIDDGINTLEPSAPDSTASQESTVEAKSADNDQIDFDEIQNTIPEDLPTDSSWDEVFDSNPVQATNSSTQYSGEDSNFLENSGKLEDNIQEHLQWQLELTPMTEQDRRIADAIIDAVNEDGYLSQTVDELLEGFSDEPDIESEEIEAVLHLIHNFDPPGVAARDLQENLAIQLRFLDDACVWKKEAQILVDRHLNLLANRDFATLKRRMKLDEDSLAEVIRLIKSLNPRPGGQISDTKTQYIVPDVIVKKVKGVWHAELNIDSMPPLAINKHYMNLAKEMKKSADAQSLKDHLQEARWFIKSLQSRNDTLLKVARCILDFQRDFFDYGDEYMKALVLADVANVVEMHESTISRVTTQKYMHTPKGIFELKYFFSSHVSTASGGEVSATAIRAVIRKLISNEDSRKPLSDNKLSKLLEAQNYKVARRTIAKYRESMSIPPSNERKSIV